MIKRCLLPLCLGLLANCSTITPIKNLKTIGFSDDVSKGTRIGQAYGDSCVFSIFGYPLGGQMTVATAIENARYGRKSTVMDSFSSGGGESKTDVRYINDLKLRYDGFDIVVFAKMCLVAEGVSYK
jgi:hypothetical protein